MLDRDGVYGAPQFYRAAKAAGLKAIVGAELTMGWPEAQGSAMRVSSLQPVWSLPVLVASAEGYRNLCRLITRAKLRAPKGESRLTIDDLDGQMAGLVALVGRQALGADRHGVGGLVDRLVGVFGRRQVWMEVQRHYRRDEQAAIALASRPRGGVSRSGDGLKRRAVCDT